MTTRCAKVRTVGRCEAYLDKLAQLIAQAGEGWVVYQPLVERLEQESRQAREALAMRERMLKRQKHRQPISPVSPPPRMIQFIEPSHPGALTLDQICQLAGPGNSSLDAENRRHLMMVCRDRKIVRACLDSDKSIAFVR